MQPFFSLVLEWLAGQCQRMHTAIFMAAGCSDGDSRNFAGGDGESLKAYVICIDALIRCMPSTPNTNPTRDLPSG